MACGCPVIVGRETACEEVAGEAAVLVDPTDTKSIVDAVRGILENRDEAERYSQAGLMRSERFSWRKAAEQTMIVYRQLALRRFPSVIENTPDRSG
jgi:glycosyltransferase involved in cell wall biosynthesis